MTSISCPVCGGGNSLRIDERAGVPILMHRLFDDAAAARACAKVSIDLRRCEDCGFAWNARFDAATMVYGPDYDNAQAHSPQFRAHLDERIDAIFAHVADRNEPQVIVEVGCGQGDFLARLIERQGKRVKAAFGFDPAWRGADGDGPAGTKLYRRLFDASASEAMAEAQPDIVISRHTIEHIAEPVAFLAAIRAGIGQRKGTRLFLETPDIRWIMHHKAFEDVFYEHCSIFDAESLALALRSTGFEAVTVEACFGAQYLWAKAIAGDPARDELVSRRNPVETTPIDSAAFSAEWRTTIAAWRGQSRETYLWGAGAKGMTFAQLVDPEARHLAGIIDLNPGKQNRHIGLSGHIVLAPDALRGRPPLAIIVMNPVYLPEIRSLIEALGVDAIIAPLHGEAP